ncbi:MAG TPA: PadR family transcriptional regulator [Candidatus Dormibacteraeota bacterium]|nr:PadR family transcriptional regulator [Candidatus Dormibacteraeota bacterium]
MEPAPLTPAAFHVLLAIAAGRNHGYAVMRYVEETSDGTIRLGPGTLYRTIGRLLADGLVEEWGGVDPDAPHDARRRYYRLTELGQGAARAEARSLERMVAAAREAGLLPSLGWD